MKMKWEEHNEKINSPLTEEDKKTLISELGCNQCPEESGSSECYLHILAWAMDRIRGSKPR